MKRISVKIIITAIIVVALNIIGYANTTNTNFKAEVFTKINEIRIANGVSSLNYNAQLEKDADIRAEEQQRLFSHTRPDGSDWYTVDPSLMYGENLAKNYNNPEDVMVAWMNSPEHKENILRSDYKSVGVGIYTDNQGITYWAQEYSYF